MIRYEGFDYKGSTCIGSRGFAQLTMPHVALPFDPIAFSGALIQVADSCDALQNTGQGASRIPRENFDRAVLSGRSLIGWSSAP